MQEITISYPARGLSRTSALSEVFSSLAPLRSGMAKAKPRAITDVISGSSSHSIYDKNLFPFFLKNVSNSLLLTVLLPRSGSYTVSSFNVYPDITTPLSS